MNVHVPVVKVNRQEYVIIISLWNITQFWSVSILFI
uniref:Uncharacterized protein n=1 Tax=Glossina morsitans morsitans TaxID=37546 RepID=A0A1B0G791_GLOMM